LAHLNPDIPRNYAEAVAGADAPRWREAMDQEIQSFNEKGVYKEVKLP